MIILFQIALELPRDESRKNKVNPKRQKLAELAATLKSSDKRSERARKRKERDNKERNKENNFGDDDRSSNGNRLAIFSGNSYSGVAVYSSSLVLNHLDGFYDKFLNSMSV